MMRKTRPHNLVRRWAALAFAIAVGGCEGSSVVGLTSDGGGMDAPADIACGAGQTRCGSQCVDLRGSALNCGACGTSCPAGNVCVNGACRASCPGTQTLCNNNTCVSTGTDRAHCGACNNVCPAGQVCSNGACTVECASNLQLIEYARLVAQRKKANDAPTPEHGGNRLALCFEGFCCLANRL